MFLVEKGKSALHRVRTAIFKRTRTWAEHPLNIEPPETDWPHVDRELESLQRTLPFTLKEFNVDAEKYAEFKRRFWPGALYAVGYKDKKIMEHFVSYTLLGLSRGDRYVDVASENSPFPALYRRLIGAETYSQDLSYPSGVHGWMIGSSADNMPLESASVDKMSMQCSFEHFQNDVDRNFIRESARTLKPGGKCVIVPLYLASRLLNIADPVLDSSSVRFDEGALALGETNLGGLFERYYSPRSLDRILIPALGLSYEIFRVRIPESIRATAAPPLERVRYALCITKDA
jgi:hypothetical protein